MAKRLSPFVVVALLATAAVVTAATRGGIAVDAKQQPAGGSAVHKAAVDSHPYPRTYHLFSSGPLDEMARYDMVVGFRSFDAAALRKRNPNGIFLLNPGIEGEDGYDALSVTGPGPAMTWKGARDRARGGVDLGEVRAVDPEWDLLHNADGSIAPVSEHFASLEGWNLAGPASKGTPALVAKLFAYAAKQDGLYRCHVKVRGKRVRCWSGVHSDNWIYTAIGASWFYGSNLDADRDGKVDDSKTLLRNWSNGLTRVGKLIRTYLPGFVVGGNGAWYRSDEYAGTDPNGWLTASNYTLVEHMEDVALASPETFLATARRWLEFPDPNRQPRYMAVLHQLTDPDGEEIRLETGDPNKEELQRIPEVMRSMRWGLTLSLMTGVYYGLNVDGNFNPHTTRWWFDEFDGGEGIRRRGYLGRAVGGYRRLSDGVYRRDFQNGIAINNSSSKERTIALGETYRKLRGTQNPELNDGSAVSSVVVAAKDGIILLRTSSS